jgi:SAM-dependent methyltransferase
VTGDRRARRRTFDSAAAVYDRARPDYPVELYDELERLAGLRPRDRLLEVGCGTGRATAPLAHRGYRIVCVELGGALADVARHNLAAFQDVQVVHAAFEDWAPGPGEVFDMVFAATTWHWIDPEVRYRKAAELLRPGGCLGFWSATHVFPVDGDGFFREIQEIYDEIGEGLPPDAAWPAPGELPDDRAEIEASGLFDVVAVRQFDWEVGYDADAYLDLLDSFSGHIAMASWQRDRLYGEIRRRLSARPDGRLRRHWGCVLHVARRRD